MRKSDVQFVVAAVAGCLAVAAVPRVSSADITAKFDAGTGTTSSDQWTGSAGNGWSAGWVTAGQTTATGPATAAPLTGGSSTYLQFVDNTTTATVSARRAYDTFGSVTAVGKHRITFKYRFDGDTSAGVFNDFGDRLNLIGDTADTVGSTATSNTWLIGVIASNTGASASQSAYPGHWYFYDNATPAANGAFNTGSMVDTGLTLVTGRTYSITVDVDPTTFSYAATINDGVSPTFSATDLNFRRANTGPAITTGSINFADTATAGTDSAAFSVSDLNISAVPEPSAVGLLAVGAAGLLRRRRRSA